MASLTVLDASILLAHFDRTDKHHRAADAILADAEELAASTLTLAEVLVGAARADRLEEQLGALAALQIEHVPVDRGAVSRLAELRANTRLRLPDCCVIDAALTTDATAIATRDRGLMRWAQRLGLNVP